MKKVEIYPKRDVKKVECMPQDGKMYCEVFYPGAAAPRVPDDAGEVDRVIMKKNFTGCEAGTHKFTEVGQPTKFESFIHCY